MAGRVCLGPAGISGDAGRAELNAAAVVLFAAAGAVGYRLAGGPGLLLGVGAAFAYQLSAVAYLGTEAPPPWFCLPAGGR